MTARYLATLKMPALPQRSRSSTHLMARMTLLKERPDSLAHLQLAATFIRAVEFAVLTYRLAKSGLTALARDRSFNGWCDGISALETCLTECHRAIRFATVLSRAGLRMPDGTPLVPRSARSGILSRRTASRIARLRNTQQHLDERILSGDLGAAQAFGPRPESTGLSLGRMSVQYCELAAWLSELDALAARVQYITRCRPTRNTSDESSI